MPSRNQYVSPQVRNTIEQMKWEIAAEFGVNLGPDTSARENGSVGGEITKRLVAFAEEHMFGQMRR
ncbi:alpha/beta-type small acid-soluble spore protein [Alicyclobacillus macrosporangiidus]|uniref:Small acid-soluble spore protein A (Major alpha-type SASP) n=1 Tax=Alicyclobacillus macrosporangiidus TaxID=392015 RepID=A0A1I7KBL5_9BACL|nr:alpha/beta-type small acid-soluble spore protein [Alicyclobacillus macrosporangiidus]SFU94813.1 small acid-soluble spore protein A (major alpha-type SASP) [Alicyclobacillus macrosporangiidus]